MTPAAPLPLAGMLRAELEHLVSEVGARRSLTPRLYVGEPGRERLLVPDAVGTGAREAGWRADLLDRAVAGVDRPVCAWITRSGELTATDHDLAWCGAALAGFARHDLELPGFFVLHRHGWLDLISGEQVRFHRIRRR